MANLEHLNILRQGVVAWNHWRKTNPTIKPDLSHACLMGLLRDESKGPLQKGERTNFSGIDLSSTNLRNAILEYVVLDKAHLEEADLEEANLKYANFKEAHLENAVLKEANLRSADLSGANLSGANLMRASLVETNLEGAILTDCNIYGVAVWGVKVNNETAQSGLRIANYNESPLTVDNLKVAQFLYLIINNKEIREAIDTISSKVVLILGRFTKERKSVLDALREELGRQKDDNGNQKYIPVIFDFAKPDIQNYIEPVTTLAQMARFVIADFTDSKQVNREVPAIVNTSSVPILPLWQIGYSKEWTPGDFGNVRSVLEMYEYKDKDSLLATLSENILAPLEDAYTERLKRHSGLRPPEETKS